MILAHAADRDWKRKTGKVVRGVLHKDYKSILSKQQGLLGESVCETSNAQKHTRISLHSMKHLKNC